MDKTQILLLEIENLVNGLEKLVFDKNWTEAIKVAILSDEKIRAYCDSAIKNQPTVVADHTKLNHLHQRNTHLIESILTRKKVMQAQLCQQRKVNHAAICYTQNSG